MLEVKGTLAKLLAQEDLIVEHRQVETAQFDVERRVLTLPLWEKAEGAVLDMLIAHEVGHALFTPNKWDHLGSVPQSYVNVAEDIRIEKLMKRRYAGLPKTFRKGYEKFAAEDFFQLEGQDLSKFSLADRLNLFFKIGHFVDIPFTEEEEDYKLTGWDLETFEEVLQFAKDIYTYDKGQQEGQTSQTPSDDQPSQGDSNLPSDSQQDQSTQESSDDTPENNQEGDQDSPKQSNTQGQDNPPKEDEAEQSTSRGGKHHEGDLEAKTDSTLNESIRGLVDSSAKPINYIQTPQLDLKRIIVSNTDYIEELEGYWNEHCSNDRLRELNGWNPFAKVDEDWNKFKSNSNREVNYLVKEFECRKAASSYARASVSRTGVLDTKKLHSYRYNDDIFKKITITPDGKNHGLIFNLDWSGSMSTVIHDTVKQLLNLVSFCRKVKIPFEVYAFTNEWARGEECWYESPKVDGDVIVAGFNLINVLTSQAKPRDIDKSMQYLFRMSNAMDCYNHYGVPNKLCLSGTPLNEALVTMKQIIPQFQKKNGVEKVHLINLTDGEGSPLRRWSSSTGYYHEVTGDRLAARDLDNCQLRDRKLGRLYKAFDWHTSYYGDSKVWVENLRDHFPSASIVMIRLISGNEFKRSIYRMDSYTEKQAAESEWRKHRSFIDHKSAYTRSLYIHSNTFDESKNEFEVKEDAKKGDITRAFKKSLKNKKSSKRILNEFVTLIA